MGENLSQYVICRCQQCDGGIEFDTSNFAQGETRTTECPHCKMGTLLFVPASEISRPTPQPPSKVASPTTAIILWIIATVLLLIGIVVAISSDSDSASFVFGIMLIPLIAAAISTGNYRTRTTKKRQPPKPNFICTNCGTLLTWPYKTRPTEKDLCSACGTNSVVPLETPRGQELFATYHGAVTAKERVEIGDEATRKLLRTLEPFPASGSIAIELEKLAALVRTGAITADEWQRAKNLYLGQPEGKKREHALARIRELHNLQQSGAVSESEFNAVKWDILSRGVV